MRRLIKEHPTSKLLDEANYRLGEFDVAAGDLPAAIGDYEVVATKFAESPFSPFALQGKGWAEYEEKDFAKGLRRLGRFCRGMDSTIRLGRVLREGAVSTAERGICGGSCRIWMLR